MTASLRDLSPVSDLSCSFGLGVATAANALARDVQRRTGHLPPFDVAAAALREPQPWHGGSIGGAGEAAPHLDALAAAIRREVQRVFGDAAQQVARLRTCAARYALDAGARLVALFSSHADEADFALVFGRTAEGITLFLVEQGTPGFEVIRQCDTMGGDRPSELLFVNCRVPAANVLGEPGKAFDLAACAADRFAAGAATPPAGPHPAMAPVTPPLPAVPASEPAGDRSPHDLGFTAVLPVAPCQALAVLADVARWQAHMPDVRAVEVVASGEGWRTSDWTVAYLGKEVRWRQRDEVDPVHMTIRSRQVAGTMLRRFDIDCKLLPVHGQTHVQLSIRLEVARFPGLILPAIREVIRRNYDGLIAGIAAALGPASAGSPPAAT